MKKYLSGKFACRTDIGKVRLTNEDQAAAITNAKGNVLLLVCDGMGGASKGDLASRLAKETITEAFLSKRHFLNPALGYAFLNKAVRKANNTIYQEAAKNPLYKSMGTTVTAVLIVRDSITIGQVGDSRAYTIRDGKLVRLTEDQTYVDYLRRTGQITEEEVATHPKRHVLMNACGIYPSLTMDNRTTKYNREKILVCSDGLYNNVPEADIFSVLNGTDTPEMKVNELISLANSNGGSDNIAVVIWEAD